MGVAYTCGGAMRLSAGALVGEYCDGGPRRRNVAMPAQKYDVHPGVKMMQDWIGTLKAKTGRSLEEWVRLVKKEGPKEEEARRAWLKEEHGLGTNAAWWIAERSDSSKAGTWDDDPEAYLKCAAEYV